MPGSPKEFVIHMVEVLIAIGIGLFSNVDKLNHIWQLSQGVRQRLTERKKRVTFRKVYELHRTGDMIEDFEQFIQEAIAGKFYPGYPEIAYTTLKRGGSISDVRERLGATQATWDRWMADHEEFRVAIELGLEAGTSSLQKIGFDNLTSRHFQAQVWKDLLKMLPKAAHQLDEIDSRAGQISVSFVPIQEEE